MFFVCVVGVVGALCCDIVVIVPVLLVVVALVSGLLLALVLASLTARWFRSGRVRIFSEASEKDTRHF